MTQELNAQFNQTLVTGATSTYTRIGEYEVLQKTPVEGGVLLRDYNFASDHKSVDGFLYKDGQSTYLGTKDFSSMPEQDRIKAQNTLSGNK